MIVIWSATFEISFSLCEMMIDAMPCFLKSSRRFSSFWLSLSFSDAVGSSRMSSLTFLASALAISTSCCLPIPMLVISVSGFSFEADEGEELARAREGAIPVDDAEPGRLVAEEHVLGDRQERHERQFLVDDDDPEVLGLGDVAERHRLALVEDVARVGPVRVDTRQHFHQRRLAGTVLAADGMDLARDSRRD